MNQVPNARIIGEAASSGSAAEQLHDILVETACGFDTYTNPALGAVAAVHAAHLATGANAFPGPITQPDVPRCVAATFAALWDGGDITIHGVDARGQSATEVLADNPGATVAGVVPFASITSISKQTVGVAASAVTIDTTDKLGLSKLPVGDVWTKAAGVSEDPAAVDLTNGTFTPTTAPDGAVDFVAFYPANVE